MNQHQPPHQNQKFGATALITKIFPFYILTILLPLTFSDFFDWNNSPILWSQRLLNNFPHCFQISSTTIWIISHPITLYLHRFIIIFNLTLQQCFLWLYWTKLVGKVVFLYSIWVWKYITKIWYEKKKHLTIFSCS